jgi:uncharacterized membrane protein YeiH
MIMINTVDYNLLIGIAEIVGTAVFAITGAIAAQGKRLDIFGVVVLAIVAAVGGGTVRDVILDASPVFWVANNTSLYVAIVSAIVAFIACRYLSYPRRLMLILDAAGLALFVVLGAEKAHSLGLSPLIIVVMGCITGCAGGLIRDILTREIPLILHAELYATCAIIGASYYVLLADHLEHNLLALSAMLIIFVLRLAAIFGDLSLPKFVMAGHKLETPEEARDHSIR